MPDQLRSIGKIHGLQQLSTPTGAIALLALDHRNNLRNLLKPDAPGSVTDEELIQVKKEVVRELGSYSSGILLDPKYGAAQCIAAGVLPAGKGLVVALEETGYTGEPTRRHSHLLEGWSVEKAKMIGCVGIKLLVYYHPESPVSGEIEQMVQQVANECRKFDIALFLEPLSYSLDPYMRKLTSYERREVVLESARRLTPLGVDILEAEFPLDLLSVQDDTQMLEACAELTRASAVPWLLISGMARYYDFMRQVNAACRSGASGVAVGRAIWQEALPLMGEKRREYLQQVTRPRLERLVSLCDAMARPWSEVYGVQSPTTDWYNTYLS